MTAFYSAPHLRPPMALQYAIWTMATNGHPKYHTYHDAFHSRARHYLQEDEMRVSLSVFKLPSNIIFVPAPILVPAC